MRFLAILIALASAAAGGAAAAGADQTVLQWPLGLELEAGLAQRDLDFWASRTNFSYMYTGDAAYSVAYLALGLRAAADAQLGLAFAHIDAKSFFVFSELAQQQGCLHFITGAGGLLQTLVFGYPGLRLPRRGVLAFASQQPVLSPMGAGVGAGRRR